MRHTGESVVFSPTGYRLGFGSPTRLVRFGFVETRAFPVSVGSVTFSPFVDGRTFTSASVFSPTGPLSINGTKYNAKKFDVHLPVLAF